MWRFIDTLLEPTPFGVTFVEKPSSRKQSLMELQDSTDHIKHKTVKGWASLKVVHCLQTLLLGLPKDTCSLSLSLSLSILSSMREILDPQGITVPGRTLHYKLVDLCLSQGSPKFLTHRLFFDERQKA